MPTRRPPRVLPLALIGASACLLAADAWSANGVGARTPHPAVAVERRASARRAHAGHAPRGAAPATPPADSDAVRRAADLVRRARDAERAAATTSATPRAGASADSAALAAGPTTGGPGSSAPLRALDPIFADSARNTYIAAAALVPEIGDWLRLRAAGVTRDAARRATLARTLVVPAVRERAPLVDALARARTGDPTGAAAALDSLGRPAQALALRLQLATDAGARRTVRAVLLELLRASTDTAGATRGLVAPAAAGVAEPARERAREAAILLDSAFATDPAAPLTPDERLRVARALADARDRATLRRAVAAFAGARTAGAGSAADEMAEAALLGRLGRWREAAAAYARVAERPEVRAHANGSPLGTAAAYERGRALLRAGEAAGARAAFRALADAAPRDTSAAAARFLLAELTADDGRDAEARAEYLRVATEQPASRWAPLARFRAAIIALAAGDARAAAADFDAAARPGAPAPAVPDSARGPSGFADSARNENAATITAATYWAGRAWAAAGDAETARARWAQILARDPSSYYAWRAATRLGQSWTPTAPAPVDQSSSHITLDPDVEAAADRAALLERVGLTPEAGYERDYLIRSAGDSASRMLTVAHALARGPRPGVGIRLAARAVERGAPRTPAVWQLLDPLLYADALRRAAAAAGVEPALAAGVIRQESNFTADAVSPVGARGLMQLMPDVGRGLWRGEGAAAWTPDLLFVPAVNLALGMRHLAAGLRGYPDPAYALAAYNAGGSRVTRWRRQPGADDPELFVERIPFAETRDYVRIVLRNRELYRALYRL